MLMSRKKYGDMKGKGVWTLREIKQALNIAQDTDIGQCWPAVTVPSDGGLIKVFLPQLRKMTETVYDSPEGYIKRVDKLISKHGPNAKYRTRTQDSDQDESNFDDWSWEINPIQEDNDATQVKPFRESDEGSCKTRDDRAEPGKAFPKQVSPSQKPTTVGGKPGGYHRDMRKSLSGELPANGGSWGFSLGGGKPEARATPEPTSYPSRSTAYSSFSFGNKAKVSSSPDASKPFSGGVANPLDRPRPKASKVLSSPKNSRVNWRSTVGSQDKPKLPAGSPAGASWGGSDAYLTKALGDVSSPLNPFSFGTFALTGAKGRRSWGLTKPTVKLSALIGSTLLSTGLDDSWLKPEAGAISSESRFRSGNPGGYIDEKNARLKKKTIKSQARKIARHFDGFFRDNEIGIGVEQTPRISGKKLVKELVGRGVRLGRTKKEEKGTGLKLVLVDISPSCASIRDACFAAALALADTDPNIVVIAHFNGYTADSGGHIVGRRQKEVPHIHDPHDLETFKAFLASGKVSGAVCFGDHDAQEVYSALSHYCPTLWLSPNTESDCKSRLAECDKAHRRAYSEARMYIVGNVYDARSAVDGLRKLKKK
jgi:hypothetical protein